LADQIYDNYTDGLPHIFGGSFLGVRPRWDRDLKEEMYGGIKRKDQTKSGINILAGVRWRGGP